MVFRGMYHCDGGSKYWNLLMNLTVLVGEFVQAMTSCERSSNLRFVSAALAGRYINRSANHNFTFRLNRYMNSDSLCRDTKSVLWHGIASGRTMIDRKSTRCGSVRLVFFALGLWASCGQAFSQAPAPPGRQIFYSNVQPLTDTIDRVQSDPRPKNTNGALQALDWLIYGNVSVGGVYDSNVFGSAASQQPVYGARFQPSVIASRNTGIQRTLVYGVGDLRYYPSLGRTDLFGTTAGVVHVWEIQRDLIFRTQFDVNRTQQSSSLIGAQSGSTYYIKPVNSTSLFGSTSIEKSFGQFFTAIGGSFAGNTYEDTTDSLGNVIDESFQDGTHSTLNGRVGYHITPIVYTFVEPSVNSGQFRASTLNSNGYRIVGGLGTARISLFNGEIYGGTWTEHFNDPLMPSFTQPIYGGRLSWFPTRFVTVTGSFDQSLGTSDFRPAISNTGTVTKVNTSKLMASWSIHRDVNLEGSVQFQSYEYLGSTRVDDVSTYGSKITYMFTERLGITLDYSYTILTSDTPGASYNRNSVSLGAISKF